MALLAVQLVPPNLILLNLEISPVHDYKIHQKLKASPIAAKIPVIFISLQDETIVIAVATAVRTRTFLWGREAPPQKRPKKNGYNYKQQVKAAGGAGFVTKPDHMETVLSTIQSVL